MERELKTERMTVRVTPTLKKEYDALAEHLGLDIAACMSMALTQWLNTQKLNEEIQNAVFKVMTTPEGLNMMLDHMDGDKLPDTQLVLPLDEVTPTAE